MPTCGVCGDGITHPYRCSHCGLTVCETHRLPENHGCDAPSAAVPLAQRRQREPSAEGIESPEPMELDESNRAGTRTDPTFESAPGVAPDGSISTPDDDEAGNTPREEAATGGLLAWLRSLF